MSKGPTSGLGFACPLLQEEDGFRYARDHTHKEKEKEADQRPKTGLLSPPSLEEEKQQQQ